jgi:hypothetical protein
MRTKEKYMNNQYASLCAEYEQVRVKLLPNLEVASSHVCDLITDMNR